MILQLRNLCKNDKNNMLKMDVQTHFCQNYKFARYAFSIQPNCIRKHHEEFEIGETILIFQNF